MLPFFISFLPMQTKLLPLAGTPDAQADLLITVLKLLGQMQGVGLYDELLLNSHTLLSTILTRCMSSDAIKSKIESALNQLADCTGKAMLAEKLSKIVLQASE